MKIAISRMHKIDENCICDTTVIFLYVHKISTSKKVGNTEKWTYAPSYPHYPHKKYGKEVDFL